MASTARLDAAYATQVKSVRATVEGYVRSRFTAGQYRDADLVRFLNEVVPVVKAGRRQVAALTDGYLSALLTQYMGTLVPPTGVIDTEALRGVDDTTVYARPFVTVRTALADGKPLDQAIGEGLSRASDLVATDLQMAKVRQSQQVMTSRSEIVGYERVLTGAHSCALCYVASTQRYHKADLMPIHPGCDCGIKPIVDTGQQVIHPDRLQATHEAVQERLGQSDPGARLPDYRKQLIVHDHGEIGRVLAIRDQHFTGPSAI